LGGRKNEAEKTSDKETTDEGWIVSPSHRVTPKSGNRDEDLTRSHPGRLALSSMEDLPTCFKGAFSPSDSRQPHVEDLALPGNVSKTVGHF
jgi:hypothetical protein